MSVRQYLARLNDRRFSLYPKIKIILGVFLLTIFGFSLLTSIKSYAETKPTFLQGEKEACGTESLCRWENSYAKSGIFTGIDVIAGADSMPQALIEGKPVRIGEWIPGGLMGTTNQAIASLYNPPASGVEYIASLKDGFLGKPAYAQGTGFRGLQPILPLWRGFRNIVYVLTSIVFIFIGIMIMLRVKISPQAVVNIQNAIPQIITTLVLVTFSYAIAGLLIDLVFFFQGAALAVLFQSLGRNLTSNLFTGGILGILNSSTFGTLSNPHLGEIFNLTFSAAPLNIILGMGGLIGVAIGAILGGGGLGAITGGTFAVPGAIGGALLGGGVGAALFALILSIIILIWIIKFFFGLAKCYFTIILKIILAPFEIGFGAIPGAKTGFNTWLRDIIANLAVFPISILFLVLANLIISQIENGMWVPSLLDGSILAGTVLGGGSFLIRAAIGICTLGLMSKLPEMIPQYIFMLKPDPWGVAVGQSFQSKAATAAGWAAGDQAFQWASTGSGQKFIANAWNKIPRVKKITSAQAGQKAAAARKVYQGVGSNVGGQRFSS